MPSEGRDDLERRHGPVDEEASDPRRRNRPGGLRSTQRDPGSGFDRTVRPVRRVWMRQDRDGRDRLPDQRSEDRSRSDHVDRQPGPLVLTTGQAEGHVGGLPDLQERFRGGFRRRGLLRVRAGRDILPKGSERSSSYDHPRCDHRRYGDRSDPVRHGRRSRLSRDRRFERRQGGDGRRPEDLPIRRRDDAIDRLHGRQRHERRRLGIRLRRKLGGLRIRSDQPRSALQRVQPVFDVRSRRLHGMLETGRRRSEEPVRVLPSGSVHETDLGKLLRCVPHGVKEHGRNLPKLQGRREVPIELPNERPRSDAPQGRSPQVPLDDARSRQAERARSDGHREGRATGMVRRRSRLRNRDLLGVRASGAAKDDASVVEETLLREEDEDEEALVVIVVGNRRRTGRRRRIRGVLAAPGGGERRTTAAGAPIRFDAIRPRAIRVVVVERKDHSLLSPFFSVLFNSTDRPTVKQASGISIAIRRGRSPQGVRTVRACVRRGRVEPTGSPARYVLYTPSERRLVSRFRVVPGRIARPSARRCDAMSIRHWCRNDRRVPDRIEFDGDTPDRPRDRTVGRPDSTESSS
mmetsp:Transcript_14028/g.32614  ORF Transcript_14028/g.32614 Transcript_14028/m.32614 type:complete len:576 (-) Transcript_14028:205-1932(-)